MARKKKDPPPKKELTAPFFMLTYGDLMTLLMTFFVLLFSMSTLQVIKFQAQIGAIQGALGISQMYAHAPMQKNLPAPSVKESPRVVAHSRVKPTTLRPLAEYSRKDLTEPVQHSENEQVKMITAFGTQGDITIQVEDEDVILTLPSYGIFDKGEYKIDPSRSEVQRVRRLYYDLAKQMAQLTDYDIYFVGHTDALPLVPRPGDPVQTNMELGFRRAVATYEYFFADELPDKTRIVFSSQGDNVPIIANAKLDSARRKNRRVEIHLKKKR